MQGSFKPANALSWGQDLQRLTYNAQSCIFGSLRGRPDRLCLYSGSYPGTCWHYSTAAWVLA